MPRTIAEEMARRTQERLETAQKLKMTCRLCGGPIQMFCCGETLPLSKIDNVRAELEFGKMWLDDGAPKLSDALHLYLQATLLRMHEEGFTEITLHVDGYTQVKQ